VIPGRAVHERAAFLAILADGVGGSAQGAAANRAGRPDQRAVSDAHQQ
jgi:hypothetical protein